MAAENAARWVLKRIVNLTIRVYFGKVEVRGRRNLPANTAAIFAGNHPSGLIDPMVLMTALPELPLSSVAKNSLFATPVVGFFLRAFKAVPVAQTYDPGLPPHKQMSAAERHQLNKELFEIVESRLINNTNIIIFPEGTCHSTYEIKDLKHGTARMALGIAAEGGPRIPIVPIGLTYSSMSGGQFRSKVLIDIGRPIEVTDELVELYKTGLKENVFAAAETLTRRLESKLRDVTVHTPNWTTTLTQYCAQKQLPPPTFALDVRPPKPGKPGPIHQRCVVVVNGKKFFSKSTTSTSSFGGVDAKADIHQDISKPLMNEVSEVAIPKPLMNDASRVAYFSLMGAANTTPASDTDHEIIEVLHLARKIYTPTGTNISLAQFAALTRNFLKVAIMKLDHPDFHRLYNGVKKYRSQLEALNITDRYVETHNIEVNNSESLDVLRKDARFEIAKTLMMAPLSVIGTVTHFPIASLAYVVGRKMGVTADGDTSVEATMRILAGFVSITLLYPAAAIGVAAYMDSIVYAPLTLGLLGASGYAAATRPVADETFTNMCGYFSLITTTGDVTKLVKDRLKLQHEIRTFTDEFSGALSPDMVGWWKDPRLNTDRLNLENEKQREALHEQRRFVTEQSIEAAQLTTYRIPLASKFKRGPDESAMLTIKQFPGNSKALLWIPGRNDSFFHVHLLDQILGMGFDLFALDLRRCGRAQFDQQGNRMNPELLAHDSYDFHEYFEEIDKSIAFMKKPSPLPRTLTLERGGCGKVYEKIVMYSHSTGCLVAALYGADGGGAWRGAIDGFIFNSPFWSWNVSMYQRVVLNNAMGLLNPERVISEGGNISPYAKMLHETYGYTPNLKSDKELTITAGWCNAVTEVQTMLKKGELVLEKPTLVLTTNADVVLNQGEIETLTNQLSATGEDASRMPLWSPNLVERTIVSTATAKSAHDVLAAPSQVKVREAMKNIEAWLASQFLF